jgi:broad specificity phosphatase PhoE
VNGWVDTWSEGHAPPGPVIAVAHFGVILTQVQRALGLTPREAFAHKIENLSVTHLRQSAQGWHALEINRRL